MFGQDGTGGYTAFCLEGLHDGLLDFLMASWDAKDLRTVIDDSLAMLNGVGAPATWVLSNHDVAN
ncbi:hypothetical protein G5C60_43975 [Streptomyces sp. HC44]|uniref:Uncharacterized protein n=1 Tax=Streptomyces scabichelini TaxID=2711217 RepID=A0A6G4VKI8_9ACTN|nr:hypothetical protein [Streptomyces scabichelini]NGO14375.1 hypothetical protein [Streptomyces scabichelini]